MLQCYLEFELKMLNNNDLVLTGKPVWANVHPIYINHYHWHTSIELHKLTYYIVPRQMESMQFPHNHCCYLDWPSTHFFYLFGVKVWPSSCIACSISERHVGEKFTHDGMNTVTMVTVMAYILLVISWFYTCITIFVYILHMFEN